MVREEYMVLSGIALMVLALVVPGWMAVKRSRRVAMARSDIQALVSAGQRYYGEYGVWPAEEITEYRDLRFGEETPNALVMNVLRALNARGNRDHGVNTKRIPFIDVRDKQAGRSGLDPVGNFLDPWGQPYQVVLDSNLDNGCDIEDSIYGRRIGTGMVVWSYGPDRESDTPDDILSWDLE